MDKIFTFKNNSSFTILCICLMKFLLNATPVFSQKLITPGYLFNSDPDCHVINGRFYIFTSHDQSTENFVKGTNWRQMYDQQCMSTKDFVHWTHHGSVVSIHDAKWAKTNAVWDGDAGIYAKGKYYAYVPMGNEIGVFVSDRPEGPYIDALGKPLISKGMMPEGSKATESGVLIEKGEAYLFWGWGVAYVAKLKPNMIELAENPVKIEVPDDFIEAPMITKINGQFYFTYSNGGLWGEHKYNVPRIMYSISDSKSLYGPYIKSRVLQDAVVNPDERDWKHKYASSAHHGLAKYKGNWYFAYHKDWKDGVHRQTGVTKLTIHKDGSIDTIDPNTDTGVTSKPIVLVLDAYAAKREAEEFHERSNAAEEKGIRQDYHFKMKDGSYLRFNNIDFGKGAGGFKLNSSCNGSIQAGGKLEVRIGNPMGEMISEVTVVNTGEITNYLTIEGKVNKVKGIHDVFLVAKEHTGDSSKDLFNINWFTFTRK